MKGWRAGEAEGWRLEGCEVGGLESWKHGGLEGWRVGEGRVGGLEGWYRIASNRIAPPKAIPSNTVPQTIANNRKPSEPRFDNHGRECRELDLLKQLKIVLGV